MGGTTTTVNDLFIGNEIICEANKFVTHEMLDGSDHRSLRMELDCELMCTLQRNR